MPFAAEHLVDHLFRHEAGRLHALLLLLLLRWLGVRYLAEADDLVQDTLVEALTAWRLHGPPTTRRGGSTAWPSAKPWTGSAGSSASTASPPGCGKPRSG